MGSGASGLAASARSRAVSAVSAVMCSSVRAMFVHADCPGPVWVTPRRRSRAVRHRASSRCHLLPLIRRPGCWFRRARLPSPAGHRGPPRAVLSALPQEGEEQRAILGVRSPCPLREPREPRPGQEPGQHRVNPELRIDQDRMARLDVRSGLALVQGQPSQQAPAPGGTALAGRAPSSTATTPCSPTHAGAPQQPSGDASGHDGSFAVLGGCGYIAPPGGRCYLAILCAIRTAVAGIRCKPTGAFPAS